MRPKERLTWETKMEKPLNRRQRRQQKRKRKKQNPALRL